MFELLVWDISVKEDSVNTF